LKEDMITYLCGFLSGVMFVLMIAASNDGGNSGDGGDSQP
jgi:hypothetical protein